MGLDMYAMVTDEQFDSEVDVKPERPSELQYWRKHPNLHGWMEKLYFDKGGSADCFNCVCVALIEADLAFIAKAREATKKGLTVFYNSWW